MTHKRAVAALRPLLAAALLAGTAATGANAQIVPFSGQTMACFSLTLGGCTPTAGSFHSFYGNNTVTDLTGRVHFNTTALSFGVPRGTTVPFSLGLLSTGTQYANGTPVPINEFFTLAVSLVNPVTMVNTFQALATGQLTFLHSPLNPTVSLSFTGPGLNGTVGPIALASGGSYTLTANSGMYTSDLNYQPLMGTASATVTPEPVTMTLFGTGLSGLAFLRRRRKKAAENADA